LVGLAACSSDPSEAAPVSSSVPTHAVRATVPEDKCDGITPEIEHCLSVVFERLDQERARLEGRLVVEAHQPEPLQPFQGTLPNLKAEWQHAEQAFVAYRDRTCDAVWVARYPGTWAGIEGAACKIRLDRERIAFLRIAIEAKGGY
jgi:uncharacterized protein YecT (DUF1311 family)